MTEACIQVVPALCIHGFRFSPGTQGFVLSLSLPLLSRFESQFGIERLMCYHSRSAWR